MTAATWDAEAGKWKITVKSPEGEFVDTADVVVNCVGGLSDWKWPDIPGLHEFKGKVVHSAHWDLEDEGEKKPWEGKNVAVIGVVCDLSLVMVLKS